MNDMSDHRGPGDEPPPTPTEMRASQTGRPRMTIWVLLLSLLVCLVIGGMILTDKDEVPPSTNRGIQQATPDGATAPPAPQSEPKTRQ
jgi:hypothetical protein